MGVTHIANFMYGLDATKIMSPDKISGLKYLFGTDDEKELLNRYVGYLNSRIASAIADQSGVRLLEISLNTKDEVEQALAQKRNIQNQNQNAIADSQHNEEKQENVMTDKENKLLNDIKSKYFELISGAVEVNSIYLNTEYAKNETLINEIKVALGDQVIVIFDKTVKWFKFKTTKLENKQGEQ